MRIVLTVLGLASLTACAEVTLDTEWQYVPDTNTVGSILNLGHYNATNAANWAISQYDTTNLAARISAKYTKPDTGIPMSDLKTDLQQTIYGKQDALVSGTNIKTINNQSILGLGNIVIEGGGGGGGVSTNAVDALIASYDATNLAARIAAKADRLTAIYDFNCGTNFTRRLYEVLTNVIATLGGTVTNTPAFN